MAKKPEKLPERLPESRHNEDAVICPWCGFDNGEDEMHSAQEIECDECEKTFFMEPEYTVKYDTYPAIPRIACAFGKCPDCGKQYAAEELHHGTIPVHILRTGAEPKLCTGSGQAPVPV